MKKKAAKKVAKKLEFDKTIISRLDPVKLREIWGGGYPIRYIDNPNLGGGGSTAPGQACQTTQAGTH